MRILKKVLLTLTFFLGFLFPASPALADIHPFLFEFGSFTTPNGIAVDESSGDVYVTDITANTVSRFDASGKPVGFECNTCGAYTKGNTITGTPTGPFTFSTEPFSTEPGTPAAVAVDNSTSRTDPSTGDLYVLDLGGNRIDKFNANGEALTPITGPFAGALLGVGVDASGEVRIEVGAAEPAIDVFDDATANDFVNHLAHFNTENGNEEIQAVPEHGFAAGGLSESSFALFSCGCVGKLAANAEEFGPVDSEGSTDVAVAVDPANGHVYIDNESSVGHSIGEWDTGQMNGMVSGQLQGLGAPVSGFGASQLSQPTGSSGQGGLAVSGSSGDVYVSNPADGKVYVFGSTAPAVVAGAPTGVTQTSATLHGTVDPREVPVTSCVFEYATTPSTNLTLPIQHMDHSVACAQEPVQIGSGTGLVAVSADVSGLEPGSLYHFRLVAGNANGASPSAGLFPTVTAGFGMKSFEVAFLNKDDTSDTQAGSHPYEMVTNVAWNTQIVQRQVFGDLRYEAYPAGNPKDLIFHFPPGFVGDTSATTQKCTLVELEPESHSTVSQGNDCPAASQVGTLEVQYYSGRKIVTAALEASMNTMVPPSGIALQLGGNFIEPNLFVNVGVPGGGNSGAVATVKGVPVVAPVLSFRQTVFGGPPLGSSKPFLTMPTACNGPLTSTMEADSYQEPENVVKASSVTRNAAGSPGGMTGCAPLVFPPSLETQPDVSNASSASGLNVDVHVSQKAAQNPEGLAESTLRDTTVALPAGVAVNPSGGDGLEGCSQALVGFTGFSEFNSEFEPGDKTATFTSTLLGETTPGVSFCPGSSKIGTAKLKTPLLEHELEGSVYLAAQNQNPFGSLIAMYMAIEDPVSGTLVKIPFEVRLCESTGQVINGVACEAPGQIVTTAHNTPELPFEDLALHFFGGERAPLTTPPRCGTYTTQAAFTPWDGNGPVDTTATFDIDHGPNGGPCPGATLPFSPSLAGGTTNINAGGFSPLSTTISRPDGDQNMRSVVLHMPAGLSGLLSSVKLCPEAQANAGSCGPESLIGETTVSAGVGSDPVTVRGGKVYLTEHYAGAPFGLSIVNPVKAGPFDLEHDTANPNQDPACDCVVVRAKIDVDPTTAALTITTDASGPHAIPSFIDGVPVQIKAVNVTVNREHFTFNPTSCDPMSITGALGGDEGASSPISVPFQATNCAVLKYTPTLGVSTAGAASRVNGASLKFRIAYPKGSMGTQANFNYAKFTIPRQLPARLGTIQKACLARVFETERQNCPAASIIGHALVHTQVLPVPLEGPVYFVSYGGAKFPDAVLALKGYGVTIELHGHTLIDGKTGQTSATFEALPDVPFESIEVTVPQGRYSEFGANLPHGSYDFCGRNLTMPVTFKAANGLTLNRTAPVSVTGCAKTKTRKQKLTAALAACHRKHGHKRATCEKAARAKYGFKASKTVKKKTRR